LSRSDFMGDRGGDGDQQKRCYPDH
jgi:hypothetical protein